MGGDSFILSPAFTNAHDHGRAIGTLALGAPDDFLEIWAGGFVGAAADTAISRRAPFRLAAAAERCNWRGAQPQPGQLGWDGGGDSRGDTRLTVTRACASPCTRRLSTKICWSTPSASVFSRCCPPELRAQFTAPDRIELSADAYFDMLDELYDAFHDQVDHHVHIQASPAGRAVVRATGLIRRACDWARRRNSRVQMHLLETR